jgi:hypothetical protein
MVSTLAERVVECREELGVFSGHGRQTVRDRPGGLLDFTMHDRRNDIESPP